MGVVTSTHPENNPQSHGEMCKQCDPHTSDVKSGHIIAT